MDTQPEITESKVDNVTEHQVTAEVVADGSKGEKVIKDNIGISNNSESAQPESIQENSQPTSTLPPTVIATRQRMITTQGHIISSEISVTQGQEVPEQYEQYQITASGDDQNVYTYEQTTGGIITLSNQPENLQTTNLLKRDILIEKEHNGNANGPVVNVVSAEPQTVYVELKNDNIEQARYLQNATTIRYESADRYHRFAYHGLPPHNTAHIAHHQRELALKESGHQTPQEIQIYEAEQGTQSHQQSNQQGSEQNSIADHQANESKTHYTNLEPVGTSQSSYYISSESYQPSNTNGFTYLPTTTSKEGPYVYHHPGSPVLYKSKYSFTNSCFTVLSIMQKPTSFSP